MEEKFIKGLFTSRRENSPEFVLASLSFKTEQFIEWLKDHTNSKGYCNVDVLKSKDGVIYSKHNDWQPSGDGEKFVKKDDKLVVEDREEDLMELEFGKDIKPDEIPFFNMAHITVSIEPQSLNKLNKLSKEMKISRGKTIEKLINNFYKFREVDKVDI